MNARRGMMVGGCMVAVLGGCGESGDGDDNFTLTRATNTQVERLITSELGAAVKDSLDEEIEGRPRVREVDCSQRRTCVVRYTADEPLSNDDAEEEILEAQRPVWRQLFSDRQLKSGQLTALGETVSTGGKQSVSPVLELTCDRAAHRQIDWGNVTAEGMRELCDYQPLISFD